MKIKFYFLMGIGGIKKNDRGVTATMKYCKNFSNVTMYNQYNNK
jgi:hypothetical protein